MKRIEDLLTPPLKALIERRSIRAFLPDPLSPEELGILLEAVRQAPTAGNLQAVHVILVQDAARKTRIARAAHRQDWLADAPSIFILVSRISLLEEHYGEKAREYALQDAAIAGISMLLAAHALGLGGCYVAAFDEDQLREAVGLPEDVLPVTILPIGKPQGIPEKPSRKPPELFISFEAYGRRPPRSMLKGSLELKRILTEEAERFLPPLREKIVRTIGRVELSLLRDLLEARTSELAELKEELSQLHLKLREAEAERRIVERKAAWKTGPWTYHVLRSLRAANPPFTRRMLLTALREISFKGYRIEALVPYLPPRIPNRRELLRALKKAIEEHERRQGNPEE